MKILLATTEAVPLVKTGGLGDVCGALPGELKGLGHDVVLFLPAFRQVQNSGLPIEPTGIDLEIPIGNKTVRGTLLKTSLPGSGIPVYLVDQPGYYDRAELYRENGDDFKDNCERFVFFCRAVMESIRLLDLSVDLIHTNDWQTGLIPALLDVEYRGLPGYENIATLLTIHNMAYQGSFWHWDMVLTGLDWKHFNWREMEFYGNLNLLKTGIAFADAINTVSARYAEEIQSAPLGCGLEGALSHRGSDLTGIINGIDESIWNPATDANLAATYDFKTVAKGKPLCKEALQQELGLPLDPEVPLIGMISRLADQKGFDLVVPLIQHWSQSSDAQWVILGTGEPKYHELLENLSRSCPSKVAVRLEFSDAMAHKIEAGSDMFLMPSRYEPCGLNQLYSLRYGTIPVVRATGGLADTIIDANEKTLAAGEANGFQFVDYSTLALSEALTRACDAYRNKEVWAGLVDTAMRQDWSWARSASEYVELYQKTIAKVRQAVCN